MLMLDQKCLRTTWLSISVPARKVRRIAPKPARKFTHSVRWRPIVLPATAPTMISMRATEIATRMDMIEAARARPSHTAEASQIFCTAHLHLAGPGHSYERGGKDRVCERRVHA